VVVQAVAVQVALKTLLVVKPIQYLQLRELLQQAAVVAVPQLHQPLVVQVLLLFDMQSKENIK
jgi:hypothetical protein